VAFNNEMANLFGGTAPVEPPQYWFEKLWEVLKTITLVRDASGTPQIKL